MKNAIKYYYNLNVENIHQIKKNYKFKIQDTIYMLNICTRNYEEIKEIYNLQLYLKTIGFYCHQIILNKNNEIVTIINEMPYVLLKVQIQNRKINIGDIKITTNVPINNLKLNKIKRDNWYNLWSKKIDYVEYQISQFGKKYTLIRESSDYYIGIVENCISILIELKKQNQTITISHDRINKNTTTEEFYNPLNYIIDNRVRDIGEYIKSYLLEDKDIIPYLERYIIDQKLDIDEIKQLFVRIIYPSKYLDTCEEILNKQDKEKELLKIINNSEEYEQNIKRIYKFLKNIVPMPEIEWLNNNIKY